MAELRRTTVADADAVAEYKRILQNVLYSRPSGTRQRLAEALGNKASYISQIANPSYSVPIPGRHLEAIFEVCHFSPSERANFLEAYRRAHPHSVVGAKREPRWRKTSIRVPDLRNPEQNARFDSMLADIALRLARMLSEDDA